MKAKETKENKTDIAQRFKRTSRRVSSQDKTFRMYGTERCYGVYKCASVTHARQVDGSGYIVSVDRHLELVGRFTGDLRRRHERDETARADSQRHLYRHHYRGQSQSSYQYELVRIIRL